MRTIEPTAQPSFLQRFSAGSYGTFGETLQATGTANDRLGYAFSFHRLTSAGDVVNSPYPNGSGGTWPIGDTLAASSTIAKLRYALFGGAGFVGLSLRDQAVYRDISSTDSSVAPGAGPNGSDAYANFSGSSILRTPPPTTSMRGSRWAEEDAAGDYRTLLILRHQTSVVVQSVDGAAAATNPIFTTTATSSPTTRSRSIASARQPALAALRAYERTSHDGLRLRRRLRGCDRPARDRVVASVLRRARRRGGYGSEPADPRLNATLAGRALRGRPDRAPPLHARRLSERVQHVRAQPRSALRFRLDAQADSALRLSVGFDVPISATPGVHRPARFAATGRRLRQRRQPERNRRAGNLVRPRLHPSLRRQRRAHRGRSLSHRSPQRRRDLLFAGPVPAGRRLRQQPAVLELSGQRHARSLSGHRVARRSYAARSRCVTARLRY